MTVDDRTDGAGGAPLIALPEPARTGAVSMEETLTRRRSLRAFAPDPMSLQDVGQLAWAAQGITDASTGYRTAPSAGGTLPIEVDLLLHGAPGLEDGVYRYHPAEHALRLRRSGDLREAVTASTMNQGFVRDAPVVVVVAFREAELAAALQLAEGERPVYLMPVGRAG